MSKRSFSKNSPPPSTGREAIGVKIIWELPLTRNGVLVETADGTQMRIRPVRPKDQDIVYDIFDRMSAQSRRQRFFSAKPQLSESLADRFANADGSSHLAWVVFDPKVSVAEHPEGLAISFTRIFVDEDDPTKAEATLTVVDDYQRKGLGGLLIELLTSTAAIHQIDELRYEVLRENIGMKKLMKKIGAVPHTVIDDPSVIDFRQPIPATTEVDPTVGALYVLLRDVAKAMNQDETEPSEPTP